MPEKYLIVKPSSLGDIVHAFPAVSYLASRKPGAVFHWVAVPAFRELVLRHPAVERFIPFPRKQLGKISSFFPALTEFLHDLRKERYTAVLDFQGLLRSSLIAFAARSDGSAGPEDPREKEAALFYGKRLNRGESYTHAVNRNMKMAAYWLGEPAFPEPVFEFRPDPEARRNAETMLSGLSLENLVALVPGTRWRTKEWPPEFFADCAARCEAEIRNVSFVILGSSSEYESGEKIASRIHAPCRNLCGKSSISELIELISMTKAFLCNDSGPMHLAAALDIPVTAMFGPTDPVLTGPYQKDAAVLQPEIECIRCFRSRCGTMERCHGGIDPERAAQCLMRSLQVCS